MMMMNNKKKANIIDFSRMCFGTPIDTLRGELISCNLNQINYEYKLFYQKRSYYTRYISPADIAKHKLKNADQQHRVG